MDLRQSHAESEGAKPAGLPPVLLPLARILYYLSICASGCQNQGGTTQADGRKRVKGIKSVETANALGAFAQTKGTIGVSMPTKSSVRWFDDGNKVQSASGRAVKSWRA